MDRPPYDTTHEVQEDSVGFNVMFFRTPNAILKILQMAVSIMIFILVAIPYGWSSHSSGGWLNFVAALTLTVTGIFFIFYLFDLIRRLKCPTVVLEFVSRIVSVFFWFIAFIVAAVHRYIGGGSSIAAAIFCIVAMVLYIVELVLRFRAKKQQNSLIITVTDVQRVTMSSSKPAGPIVTDPHYHGDPNPANVPHTGFAGGDPAYAAGTRTDSGYMMP